MTEKIRNTWRYGCKSRPTIDFSKRVRPQRTPLALVIMGKKFRFVRSNIDVRGALGFARFTRETQIERFLDVFVLPTVAQHFTLQKLEEQMRTPARTVFFFSRGHVTRAHRAALALATGSKPDAPQRGVRE